MKKYPILFFFLAIFCLPSNASRIEQITSTLSNGIVCNTFTSFTIYGPANGTYRWQTTTDTTLVPDEIFEYKSNLSLNQSDSVKYYRRLSYNYADTSNWLRILYIAKPIITTTSGYSICSGNATQINLTANVPSTFNYFIANTNGTITGGSPGSGTSINQILTNPNNYASAIDYMVSATTVLGGCVGDAKAINVTVLPKPQITNLPFSSICSKQLLNFPLAATVPSNFSWKVASISGAITGAYDSSGNTLIQELYNPSNVNNGIVNYTIKANSLTGNCISNNFNFSIQVKALPEILSLISDTICSGGVNEQIFMNNSMPSNLSWTLVKQLGPTGASSGSGSIMRQSISNTSNSLYGIVEYKITLTSTSNGCTNTDIPISIYVAPVPGILQSPTKTICSGSNTDFIPNTAYPGKFTWTLGNQPAKISGASAALQQKPGIFQQLINTGSAVDSQIYLVKHILTEISCASNPIPIIILVSNEPIPVLDSTIILNEICSDQIFEKNFSYTPTSNVQIALLYKPISINGTSNATGNKITVQLNSNDTNPAIVKYKIYPITANSKCIGNADTFNLTINPLANPNFSAKINQRMVSFLSALKGEKHIWYFGDGDSSELQDPQHTYTTDGVYIVKHIVHNNWNCQTDSSKTITIQSTALIENENEKFKIYPNPANQLITITSPFKSEKIIISIFDFQGKLCSYHNVFGSNQYQIETNNLVAGCYWLKIETNKSSMAYKLVINKD